MANPSYYQTSPSVRTEVQHQEHIFHLYAHQQMGNNEYNIVPSKGGLPNYFGCTNVTDWDVRDAPDTWATVVARMQGVGIAARKNNESWYYSAILAFTDQRFKGSTISVQGPLGPATVGDEGDWTVVGGTGEFVYAQGVCTYKRIQAISGGTVTELRIRIVCLTFPKQVVQVQKIGPWGGNGGNAYDIKAGDQPQRLESLSIYATNFVQTIAFTYTDQTGQKQTVGPWGGDSRKSKHPTIQFGPSETVKAIYGTTNNNYDGVHTVVTSLTIITNVTTYGPYGQSVGNTFNITPPNNHNIVGFYGRAGDILDQIGVYVAPTN